MRKRDICIIICAVAVALVLGLHLMLGEVMETGAWGLSYRTEGKPPEGPASSAQLSQYDAVYLGNTAEKVIYLTFDAGYENGCTAKILDALKKHDAPAAFFLVGNYMEKNKDLVRRMVEEGHIVGNHTMHHPDMRKKDQAGFAKELKDLEALFREITGKKMPKYYRPPQGLYSQENLEFAQKMGYKTVFWSLAYADWDNSKQPTKEYAFSKLLPRIHNGAVLLLHSTSKTNAEILEELLTRYKEMGYTFASLDGLFS